MCTPVCVPVHCVCLLKSSYGVTAVLQLCPGCEKPSMIGKIYSNVLCSESGTDPNLPPSFFATKRGCGKCINFSRYDKTAEILCWERRWDSVLQVYVGPLLSL